MISKINSKDYYAAFNDQSSVVANLCNKIILNGEPIRANLLGADQLPVPVDLMLQEPLLEKINRKFPIYKTTIIQTAPYHSYEWHVDRIRGVSINLLISTNIQSYCIFGTPITDSSFYLTELKYLENTFYLFNTQQLHQVLNFSKTRFLFTIEFVQDKTSLLYSDIYKWCEQENLLC